MARNALKDSKKRRYVIFLLAHLAESLLRRVGVELPDVYSQVQQAWSKRKVLLYCRCGGGHLVYGRLRSLLERCRKDPNGSLLTIYCGKADAHEGPAPAGAAHEGAAAAAFPAPPRVGRLGGLREPRQATELELEFVGGLAALLANVLLRWVVYVAGKYPEALRKKEKAEKEAAEEHGTSAAPPTASPRLAAATAAWDRVLRWRDVLVRHGSLVGPHYAGEVRPVPGSHKASVDVGLLPPFGLPVDGQHPFGAVMQVDGKHHFRGRFYKTSSHEQRRLDRDIDGAAWDAGMPVLRVSHLDMDKTEQAQRIFLLAVLANPGKRFIMFTKAYYDSIDLDWATSTIGATHFARLRRRGLIILSTEELALFDIEQDAEPLELSEVLEAVQLQDPAAAPDGAGSITPAFLEAVAATETPAGLVSIRPTVGSDRRPRFRDLTDLIDNDPQLTERLQADRARTAIRALTEFDRVRALGARGGGGAASSRRRGAPASAPSGFGGDAAPRERAEPSAATHSARQTEPEEESDGGGLMSGGAVKGGEERASGSASGRSVEATPSPNGAAAAPPPGGPRLSERRVVHLAPRTPAGGGRAAAAAAAAGDAGAGSSAAAAAVEATASEDEGKAEGAPEPVPDDMLFDLAAEVAEWRGEGATREVSDDGVSVGSAAPQEDVIPSEPVHPTPRAAAGRDRLPAAACGAAGAGAGAGVGPSGQATGVATRPEVTARGSGWAAPAAAAAAVATTPEQPLRMDPPVQQRKHAAPYGPSLTPDVVDVPGGAGGGGGSGGAGAPCGAPSRRRARAAAAGGRPAKRWGVPPAEATAAEGTVTPTGSGWAGEAGSPPSQLDPTGAEGDPEERLGPGLTSQGEGAQLGAGLVRGARPAGGPDRGVATGLAPQRLLLRLYTRPEQVKQHGEGPAPPGFR